MPSYFSLHYLDISLHMCCAHAFVRVLLAVGVSLLLCSLSFVLDLLIHSVSTTRAVMITAAQSSRLGVLAPVGLWPLHINLRICSLIPIKSVRLYIL